ncbi:hypothetical protein [Streptomyces marincola]|uniref:Glycosyl hydrolase family 43 n=1 Tax=Streptomyces marincola TaxID=2878388 RepID=A0A1W7D468_9ACTN|nr:hypothetical protein [Streptomyces marincola]ARQ71812.1 hypothetical protein CAG99_25920 [Streptomyces marincola]
METGGGAHRAAHASAPSAPQAPGPAARHDPTAGRYGDGSYFTGYATADALTGPYTKSETPLMDTENTGITGPGGQDVVGDGTGDRLVFHGVLSEDPLVRGMYVAPLSWTGGIPSLG